MRTGTSTQWKAFASRLRSWGPISLLVLAEPVSATLLLPFVYFMVRNFGYDEKDVGAKAGWISELDALRDSRLADAD